MRTAVLTPGATLAAFPAVRDPRPAEASESPLAAFLSLPARRVLGLLADGHADDAIARRLGITVPEVKRLIGDLMTTFDAWSRPALVAAGFEEGLLTRRPIPRPASMRPADIALLGAVACGWADSRTAAASGSTVDRVRASVARLRRVLRARDRAHLVRRAVDAGVLPVPVLTPSLREAGFETQGGSD